MKDLVLNAIKAIQNEKISRNIIPATALYSEIVSRVSIPHKDLQATLNELVMNSEVIWHRTLNQTCFEILKQ